MTQVLLTISSDLIRHDFHRVLLRATIIVSSQTNLRQSQGIIASDVEKIASYESASYCKNNDSHIYCLRL